MFFLLMRVARFHHPGVKHGTLHCNRQRGEQLYLVHQHQCPVQDILGSDALQFLPVLIFVQNDVQRFVGMHSHLMTEFCGMS